MKFIYLEGMVATFHQPAGFVDDTWFAERHEVVGIGKGYFLFKFVAGETTVYRRSLNRDKSLLVTDANAHRASPFTTDVALTDVTVRESLVLVRIVKHEKLSFNFLRHA